MVKIFYVGLLLTTKKMLIEHIYIGSQKYHYRDKRNTNEYSNGNRNKRTTRQKTMNKMTIVSNSWSIITLYANGLNSLSQRNPVTE